MSPTSSSPRQLGAGAGAARHAAFKVHRDSHSIHKATSSALSSGSGSGSGSTISSVSSSSNAVITTGSNSHHRPSPAPPQLPPRRQQPVIIYTHSPKVIRTNPLDFKSIVQKLTGLESRGGRGGDPAGPGRTTTNSGSVVVGAAPQDESSSSSSESCANTTHAAGPLPPYAYSQLMPPPPAPPPLDAHCFMAPPDIPLLFAPDAAASDHLQQLCAPRGFYGQFPPVVDAAAAIGPVMPPSNMNSVAGNGGAVFSPPMVETVRTFPGYN